ncbi:DUF3027 domain-containing protein [Mycolicibacter senuensis]|uniref:DUF3027 domain-containing protein n=1 Tax=Mycolicibacter senuensis TaxID=386913 RepID=A0A7I9XLB0_9MYCO|nr:hypothetical protein MSEN_24650 [Mycolicibacter senuensis]
MTSPGTESASAAIAVPAVLAAAIDEARAAVVEFSGADTVGEHLGVDYEDATAATHRFGAVLPGYQGWQWAVVVAAVPGAAHSTVSEVVLVPGPGALLSPEWVPWDQRVRPGDLGPGDLLAPPADDPRLVPGYTSSGDPQLDEVAGELGLGRRWLMSPLGRADAAQRWHDGDYGPDSAMARSTKRVCRDCGFYLPLAGVLGTGFGVCGNEMSADGRVVDSGYGCGAHSDTPAPAGTGSPAHDPYDDGVLEIVGDAEATTAPPAEAPADADEAPAEAAEAPAESADEVAETAEAVAETAEAATEPAEAASDGPAEPIEAAAETPAVAPEAAEAPETAEGPAEPGEPDTV